MAKISKTSRTNVPSATTNQQNAARGWVSPDNLEQLFSDIESVLGTMKLDMQDEALTQAERRRLLGSGVRRYGFIDKVSDVAADNLEFAPPFFVSADLKRKLREIEILRNISVAIQQMQRINDDVLLQVSDDAFQMALAYYNTVREASRRRQPGAQAIFRLLQTFFRRPRHSSEEPTEHEVERDVKALLRGKKDGKIVIENESPTVTSGKHVVLDETHKNKSGFRATESGELTD